ncbi:hypothetical protein LPB72_06780 [Hydrogenophaga crassostreae]|uniref:TMEM205-like domain-containing protein n=1 Tax=Hydrogenophaga crassostreae TaxID=1763535 RepID=A0A167IEI3_9BURK|nr:DUF4149 domain-containing protein [Hydrogenophaga crassostreae]AOW13233.1 hypothetical protein LPB072_10595 [Hydrogenophaga crassostreae]OAD42619.1 hypothetical protein LPB72_06780 [Hydrogenophaga crassostreae]
MTLKRLTVVIAALWWGALSGISFIAVPLLFAKLGPALAGPVAAKLFSAQCWMGLGLGLAVLLILRRERESVMGAQGDAAPSVEGLLNMQTALATMGFVVLAMLMALIQEFGVAQKIITARASGGNLRLWHSVGSMLVLGQWLCAGSVLWRASKR